MKPPEQTQPPPEPDPLHLQRSVDADDPPPRKPNRTDAMLTLRDRDDKGEILKPVLRGGWGRSRRPRRR